MLCSGEFAFQRHYSECTESSHIHVGKKKNPSSTTEFQAGYMTEKTRYIFFMPLVCSKSVRCHISKQPSLRGRNGSLDPISECNAWPKAFARLRTVNCEHCLEHGQLAKVVSDFQRRWALLGRQSVECCLALHGCPSFAMKRDSTVRWAFAVTALSWDTMAGRVNPPGLLRCWRSGAASAVHRGAVSQLVSACCYRLHPLCSVSAVKDRGLDLWLDLQWPFSYLA